MQRTEEPQEVNQELSDHLMHARFISTACEEPGESTAQNFIHIIKTLSHQDFNMVKICRG